MNKKLFFIWSICLLAIVPLLAGCDKDDEEGEGLIVVESFEGTDGVEGERIIAELEDVPAVIRYERHEYVSLCHADHAEEYYINENLSYSLEIIKALIAIKTAEFDDYDLPLNTKVYISASITNVVRHFDDSVLDDDWFWHPGPIYQHKAYLKEIRLRKN